MRAGARAEGRVKTGAGAESWRERGERKRGGAGAGAEPECQRKTKERRVDSPNDKKDQKLPREEHE